VRGVEAEETLFFHNHNPTLLPLQNPDDPEATQKFQDLSRAYDIISNPEKKKRCMIVNSSCFQH